MFCDGTSVAELWQAQNALNLPYFLSQLNFCVLIPVENLKELNDFIE